jgi:NitT/TauT family transport system substrate-binding protein
MGVSFRRAAWAALIVAAAWCSGAHAADTMIKVSLDSGFEGPTAPFLLAHDRGFFHDEDLAVTIDPGDGWMEPINRVASGQADIGFGDINALIRFRDGKPGAPVKAIFMVYNRAPYAVIGRKSRGVAKPKDLEGHKLGTPTTDGTAAQWPAFAQINGVDPAKVTVETVGAPVRGPMLAGGQLDAVTGISFSSYLNLKHRGVPADDLVLMPMADYGLQFYGNAIIVNTAFAAKHPDAVKGFLRAYLKGLKETAAAPARAIDAVLRRNDAASKEVELERLRMALRDNIVTAEVKANGFGDIDAARFAAALEQTALAAPFRNGKPKLADVFDASYLPPSACRQLSTVKAPAVKSSASKMQRTGSTEPAASRGRDIPLC